MRWVNTKERMPVREGIYFVRANCENGTMKAALGYAHGVFKALSVYPLDYKRSMSFASDVHIDSFNSFEWLEEGEDD